MYLLYSLALSLVFVILSPYFAYQALRHGKYAASLLQRLGFLPESLSYGQGKPIWIHAVSVGEFLTALPLISALQREIPDCRLVVSTTTLTGQRLAHERLDGNPAISGIFYFPFDWAFTVGRVLDRVKPAAVIMLETELWPNFLKQCRSRGIPVALVNGRISARSFKRYRIIGPFIARLLGDISLAVMQSAEDAERLKALGAVAQSVRVCGNLKHDAAPSVPPRNPSERLSPELQRKSGQTKDVGAGLEPAPVPGDLGSALSLIDSPHLIVAGSTAQGEEEILLESLARIKTKPGLSNARILIAPRHPERFEEVARLIEKSGFSLARRTDYENPGSRNGRRPDAILLDTIGELAQAYEFASVVFVGGSLVNRGGHNIIEPAAYAKPIIVGPFTGNFRQIIADFRAESAVVQLDSGERGEMTLALTEQIASLMSDRNRAEAMGSRAQALLTRSRGATRCTMDAIRELLGVTGAAG